MIDSFLAARGVTEAFNPEQLLTVCGHLVKSVRGVHEPA